MANIFIIGFPHEKAVLIRGQVDNIVKRLGEARDSCTTILSAEIKGCGNSSGPYLLVRNTDLERAKKIAETLNKELRFDVEYEKIGGFLPAS